jgi:hypothetical protein
MRTHSPWKFGMLGCNSLKEDREDGGYIVYGMVRDLLRVGIGD